LDSILTAGRPSLSTGLKLAAALERSGKSLIGLVEAEMKGGPYSTKYACGTLQVHPAVIFLDSHFLQEYSDFDVCGQARASLAPAKKRMRRDAAAQSLPV
jgi:hypothetical protein